ncbi:MAG: peptidyl-prolyl cis-trans isomerase [Victivallales bacterium]|nr:peptidyl-prolyl cis-trans isomerase [Victivallales bacterium]
MIEKLNQIEEDAAAKFYKENAKFFTKLRAAHILAKFDDTENGKKPTDEIKAKAKATLDVVQQLLKEGKDFAALAKEHSDCPSKEQGGDLGEFSEGEMIPEFEEALKKLKPGELSEPVETQFGYHIIKAGETTSKQFEEVKEEIEGFLKKQNEQKVLMELTQKLMADAKVKWNVKPAQPPMLPPQPQQP